MKLYQALLLAVAASCVSATQTVARTYSLVGETSAADNPNDLSDNGLATSMAAVTSALGANMPRYGIADPANIDPADIGGSFEPAPNEVPTETLRSMIAGEADAAALAEVTLWATGYAGIFLLPIILLILSCLCCSCWCLFRGVLGLCGGKDPKDEGYTNAERSCPLVTIGIVSLLILFAAIVGFLNQAPISGGIAGGVEAFAAATEFPLELAAEVGTILDDAEIAVDAALLTVGSVINSFNTTLEAIGGISTSLDNIVVDMEDIDNDFGNLRNVSQVPGLSDTITEFRELLDSARTQAEVASNATTDVNEAIADATNATTITGQIRPLLDGFTEAGRSTITGFTDSFSAILDAPRAAADSVAEQVTFFDRFRLQGLQAAYSVVMVAILFAGMGAACSKGFPFTIAQVLGWVSVMIACLILMVHLPVGTVLVDGCGAIPPILSSIAEDQNSALPGFDSDTDVIAILDGCRAGDSLVDVLQVDPSSFFNFSDLANTIAPPDLGNTINLNETNDQIANISSVSVANITANLDSGDFGVNTTYLDQCIAEVNVVAANNGEYYVAENLTLLADVNQGAYDATDNNTLALIPLALCDGLNDVRLEVDALIVELTTNLTNIETKLFGVRVEVGYIIGNVTVISDTLDTLVDAAIADLIVWAEGVLDSLLDVASGLTCQAPLEIVDTLSSIVCDTMGVGFASTAGSALVIILLMPCFLWATIVLSKRIDNPELSEEETIGLDFAETF